MAVGSKIIVRNTQVASSPEDHPVLIVGQLRHLNLISYYSSVAHKLKPKVTEEIWVKALNQVQPSESCPLLLHSSVAALPSKCSRHSAPARPIALSRFVKQHARTEDHSIILVCEKTELYASVCAIARSYPLFSKRTKSTPTQDNGVSNSTSLNGTNVHVEFVIVPPSSPPKSTSPDQEDWISPVEYLSQTTVSDEDLKTLNEAIEAIRLTALIVDAPTNEMNVDHFLEQIKTVGSTLKIVPTIIRGEELDRRGFGGIYGVGKAAAVPPALAVLSWTPAGATETVAWVGKGIVYDTGGLSIKSKTGMPGMKRDCGGAAAILGAFQAAVAAGFNQNLHAVFCLAENSVGPDATRPDDIHTLYSGKTVEINNTDAEGRLVLADGVFYAKQDLKANIIVDVATLTGAQGIAVGKYHAAILTNSAAWERDCQKAGRVSGDMVFPVPYAPELHFVEFASALADMKNSVSDRNNAQVSCAGLFIGAQLGLDFPGIWLHVDIAAPAYTGERATGYGVALLNVLFGSFVNRQLLKSMSPLKIEKLSQSPQAKKAKHN